MGKEKELRADAQSSEKTENSYTSQNIITETSENVKPYEKKFPDVWLNFKGAEIGLTEGGGIYTRVPENYAAAHHMRAYAVHTGDYAGREAMHVYLGFIESIFEEFIIRKLQKIGFDRNGIKIKK